MKFLSFSCFLFVILLCQSVSAKDYCPPGATKAPEKEGDPWYIPESAFTREEASKALRALQSQVKEEWKGGDWPNVENHLNRIKGYLFRVYLDGYRKEFGEDDKQLKEEFCKFIREEAFVSH